MLWKLDMVYAIINAMTNKKKHVLVTNDEPGMLRSVSISLSRAAKSLVMTIRLPRYNINS